MERWFKVTARIEDGTVLEWFCQEDLSVYLLLCEQFDFIGDTWDTVVEPEMESELEICSHQNFVIREGVVVREDHRSCEIVIEKMDPPKPERVEYVEVQNVRGI